MSTSTLSIPDFDVRLDPPSPEEFQYRPMSMLAVFAFALALLSLATMFLWFLIPLSVVSLVLAGMALVRIRGARGEYSGGKLALAALVFSIAALGGGIGYQVYAYNTEVLSGYERVSFSRDISDKGFVTYDGQQIPHPDLMAMEGKKIFVKGFMYPTGQVSDLKSFLLVKDSDQCCFGGEPKVVDMMNVYMKGGQLANFYSGRVSVAGTFRLNRDYKGGKLEAIFLLDGMEVHPSRSDFDPVATLDLTKERAAFAEKMKEAEAAARAEADKAAAEKSSGETPAATPAKSATEPAPPTQG